LSTHAGPFYLSLSGPPEAFPDLNDPAKLTQVAKAVRDGLNLGSTYPLENIRAWIHSQQDIEQGAVPVRRLAEATNPVSHLLVLAYSLVINPELPPVEELKQRMDDPAVTNTLAERLGDDGFVNQDQLGKLFITVTSVNKVQQLVEVIQGTAQGADVGIPQPQPIGEYVLPVRSRNMCPVFCAARKLPSSNKC
jgi:hypothetical protein